ncbi:MAG: transposase [candidate division NC10 bacterium]|nr:transposase [candidate division NC10 bacterium]
MPRGPRLDAPGVLHHVMVRGLDRQVIFRDDRDRDDFVARLAGLVEAGAWTIYAWTLLPNHAHLLVRTARRPLARTMRSLLTGYAGTFNRRHKRSGHLFQNRYRSIVVEEDPYFLELVRYLHLNPLRAAIVTDWRALERYPYCGHGAILGKQEVDWQETSAVLRQFAERLPTARARYRTFVAEGVSRGRRHDLMGGGLIRSAGGWAAVAVLRRGRERYAGDERILGSSEFVETLRGEIERTEAGRLHARWRKLTAAALIARIATAEKVPVERLLGSGRPRTVSRIRRGLAYLWVEELGRSGRALARELGICPEAIYHAAVRGRKEAVYWQAMLES